MEIITESTLICPEYGNSVIVVCFAHLGMSNVHLSSEAETTYHFDNGVVIQHKTERDNAPSDLACAECWISYEVIETTKQDIPLLRKTFCNTCQEAFWLKMQG